MNTNNYFNPDASPIRCPKCNSSNFTEKIIGVVDVFQGMGPVCEAEYFCQCGECVGFWAYGSWHPQYLDAFMESGITVEITDKEHDNRGSSFQHR